MAVALTLERQWAADEFIRTDRAMFGEAWSYELVDGRIIAHAAPVPDHGGFWSFEAVGGEDAAVRLDGVGIKLPMAEVYAYVSLPRSAEDASAS